MLSESSKKEIAEYEEAGINVVSVGADGKVNYSTQPHGGEEYCDGCEYFQLQPDPDPTDWFRDGDKKAFCHKLNIATARSLERPNEFINIRKPLYCPLLGRELTEEEKEDAKIQYNLHKALSEKI